MGGTKRKQRWMAALTLCGALILQSTALAAKKARIPEEDGGWAPIGLLIGAAAIICLTGFLKAKRTHLT